MKKIEKEEKSMKTGIVLWCFSVFFILSAFFLFDRTNYVTLAASVIGVTSLIFNAAGNPAGQILMIIFSLLYGGISYAQAYYGEMLTYMGMTAPMSLLAFISWVKNPYKSEKDAGTQVKVGKMSRLDIVRMISLAFAVTVVFYFILAYFHTANMFFSTVSVTTSFVAVYLTYKRSPLFATAYAANDVVLICMWMAAALHDRSYVSVVVCFIAFFVNDLYGFARWKTMEREQSQEQLSE